MAASLSTPAVTIEEFHRLYGEQKPAYEFWDGIPVQKSMPTIFHSLLQLVLQTLLNARGLLALVEAPLKLHPSKEPVPDIIAGERLQVPYPTKPMPIVVEILSPGDTVQMIRRKCRFYAAQQIPRIYVFDPEDRTAERWNSDAEALLPVTAMEIPGQAPLVVIEIWAAFEERLQRIDTDSSVT